MNKCWHLPCVNEHLRTLALNMYTLLRNFYDRTTNPQRYLYINIWVNLICRGNMTSDFDLVGPHQSSVPTIFSDFLLDQIFIRNIYPKMLVWNRPCVSWVTQYRMHFDHHFLHSEDMWLNTLDEWTTPKSDLKMSKRKLWETSPKSGSLVYMYVTMKPPLNYALCICACIHTCLAW